MRARAWVGVWMVLVGPPVWACSVTVPWVQYVNLLELSGRRIEGLTWHRVFNILDYEGDGRVTVHGVRNGKRFPIAKWQDGQQCVFDPQGATQCEENSPRTGIGLEGVFDGWIGFSDRREDLRRVYLPLIVEADGREFKLTLSSRPVRNTRALEQLRSARIMYSACDCLDGL